MKIRVAVAACHHFVVVVTPIVLVENTPNEFEYPCKDVVDAVNLTPPCTNQSVDDCDYYS